MIPEIKQNIERLLSHFDAINSERKIVLQQIANAINVLGKDGQTVSLLFVCTHNSRRSHFGQIAASMAATYYDNNNVVAFSAGTEETAFNQNAINAIVNFGGRIKPLSSEISANPKYEVQFSASNTTICFSKKIDDLSIPNQNLIAIMTCTDAEQNCPIIPAAKFRFSCPYNDPKISDGSGLESVVYTQRFEQILLEVLYLFSLL